MYAMLLARFKMFPEVKEKGMSSVPRLVAFTSEHVGIYVSLQLHCQYVSYEQDFLKSNVKDCPLQCRNSLNLFCTVAALDVFFESDFHTTIAEITLTLCVSDTEGQKVTGVSVTLHVTGFAL